MKRLLSFVLAVILLCGCTVTAPEPIATTATRPDILDRKTPMDSLGDFYDTCIPLPEGHREPNLYKIGEDLLLLSVSYEDIDHCSLLLHRLDTYSGQVVASATLFSEGFATVQVYGETVCVCSAPSGKVWILDGELRTQVEYSFTQNYYDWYVSRDLKTLYQMGWDIGLQSLQLSTGMQIGLLPEQSDVSFRAKSGTAVVFAYVDPETQMSCTGMLDLATGELSTLPNRNISGYCQEKGCWLAILDGDEQTGLLGGQGQATRLFNLPEGYASMTAQGHVLHRNFSTGRIDCYDPDGGHVASVQLPMEEMGPNAYLSDDMIWDEARGGYFLLYTTFREPEDTDHPEAEPQSDSLLAFLQLREPSRTERLPLQPYTQETVPEGSATDQAVFDRAEALSRQYGVTILVADQCKTVFDDFETELITDADRIHATLSQLERALSKYPAGFFEQLRFDTIDHIEISIVGDLTARRENEYGDVSAFAQALTGKYIIVADVNTVTDTTFHHELSHVIDRRLAWDADHREGALYSEDTWAALNPKGFSYDMNYIDYQDRWEYNEKYFIQTYSRTYPTEDRATVWEQAMVGNDYPFRNAPLREKLEYYSACIRDCFDTTGWPETLPWEAVLD